MLHTFDTPTGPVVLREARREDVGAVVALLADDQLGRTREDTSDLTPYLAAFDAIDADPAHALYVLEDEAGTVVGTAQFSVLPGLSHRGASRAQLEAVRIAAGRRGGGLGSRFIAWTLDEARRRGCGSVQLTSNARRTQAHRFYERLGFVASHVGMKLAL